MSRTYRALTWEDERQAREASKRASTLVRVGSVPPASFCTGKERFPSRNDARASCKAIYERFAKRMHPYRCPRCNGFHISHTETEE